MTTAHRPTWNSAKGGSEQGGNLLVNPTRSYSAKDLPANTSLKYREPNTIKDVFAYRAELAQKEEQIILGKRSQPPQTLQSIELELKIENPFTQDADLNFDEKSNSSESEHDSNDEEDSSDEDLELLREYEKLKKEREQEKIEQEQAKMLELERMQQRDIMSGNPLLNDQLNKAQSGVYTLKRQWHEETVFKNQARTVPETKRRFINDTVRSDFHRRFLARAIQ